MEVTKALMEEMKATINEKSKCMIESYADTLNETAVMFRNSNARGVSDEEIAKRADMFWGMAVQKMEMANRELEDAQRNANIGLEAADIKAKVKQELIKEGIDPLKAVKIVENVAPVNIGTRAPNNHPQNESPCAKRARESAARIATLEAEIISEKTRK